MLKVEKDLVTGPGKSYIKEQVEKNKYKKNINKQNKLLAEQNAYLIQQIVKERRG
tara:strand:+ start:1282 stop:1446 length:165 start_codon:yes stop_codon:yes gene_type:complete